MDAQDYVVHTPLPKMSVAAAQPTPVAAPPLPPLGASPAPTSAASQLQVQDTQGSTLWVAGPQDSRYHV